MKRIHIIRHAKSDWAKEELKDFDRPLNDRGKRNAPMMAKRLLSREARPDFVVCSPARRTRETCQYFLMEFPLAETKITYEESIYEASLSALLNAIEKIPSTSNEAFFIGHNYGVSQLVEYLTEEQVAMPTCAIASIDLYIDDWNQITANCGKLIHYDYPKNEID